MDACVVKGLNSLIFPEVGVEDGNGQEVCPNGTLEGCCDFHHPVNHLGSVVLGNGVCVEWASLGLVLDQQVLVDFSVQGQLVIFTLVWGRLLSADCTLVALLGVNGSRVLASSVTLYFDNLDLFLLAGSCSSRASDPVGVGAGVATLSIVKHIVDLVGPTLTALLCLDVFTRLNSLCGGAWSQGSGLLWSIETLMDLHISLASGNDGVARSLLGPHLGS